MLLRNFYFLCFVFLGRTAQARTYAEALKYPFRTYATRTVIALTGDQCEVGRFLPVSATKFKKKHTLHPIYFLVPNTAKPLLLQQADQPEFDNASEGHGDEGLQADQRRDRFQQARRLLGVRSEKEA